LTAYLRNESKNFKNKSMENIFLFRKILLSNTFGEKENKTVQINYSNVNMDFIIQDKF
jgi:hypothetical protein